MTHFARDLVLTALAGMAVGRACIESDHTDRTARDMLRLERRVEDIGAHCADQVGRLDRRLDATTADRIERELQRVRADVQRIAGAL